MNHHKIFTEFQKIHQSKNQNAIQRFYSEHLSSKPAEPLEEKGEEKGRPESKSSEQKMSNHDFTQLIQQYSASIPPYANATLEYNEKVYQDLVRYGRFWHAKEQNGSPEEQAYKLSVFFTSTEDALDYLTKYSQSQKDRNKPHIHDACLFALPQAKCDLTVWQKLSKKLFHEKPFRDMLAQAPDLEKLINFLATTHELDRVKIKETRKEIQTLNAQHKDLKAKKDDLNEEETAQCDALPLKIFEQQTILTRLGLPFNDQLSLIDLMAFRERYKSLSSPGYGYFLENGLTKEDFARFQTLERVNDDTIMPKIIIDGQDLNEEYAEYYFMKVDVMDEIQAIRAACFGKLTNCCQSLSGEAGEPCVIHGLTSPNGGFYVLCKGDVKNPLIRDEVIAQSWAWRSQENALVFDSIEVAENIADDDNSTNMVRTFYHQAAKVLVNQYGIPRILCGSQSGISSDIGITRPITPLEIFKDYADYNDSKKQLILRDSERPWYLFNKDEESTQQTNEWIMNILRSDEMLEDSYEFCAALNRSLLKEVDLFDHITTEIQELPPERRKQLDELKALVEIYIADGLTDTVSEAIKNHSFPTHAINADFKTPLMIAIHQENITIINALISQDANTRSIDNGGVSPFIHAAVIGNVDIMKILLEKDFNMKATDSYGNSMLSIASLNNNKNMVDLLITKGVDINVANEDGITALIYAAIYDKKDMIEFLLAKGAEINLADKSGMTALMHASKSVNDEGTNKEIGDLLINNGADINAADKSKMTALMHAAKSRNKDMVKILIEKGADINEVDKSGMTALMHAATLGYIEITELLLEHDADINAANKNGMTALLYSAALGYIEITELLLKYEADTNAANKSGMTALMFALADDSIDIAIQLINKGVNSKAKSNTGNTALNISASRGLSLIVFLLLKNRDNNESSDKNESLLVAAENGHLDIVKLLLEKGANPQAVDTQGKTVLMVTTDEAIEELIKKYIKEKPTQKRDDIPETKGMLIFSNQTQKNEKKTSEAESDNQENKEKKQGSSRRT